MVSGLNRITIGIFVIVGIIIFGMFFAWTQKSEIVVTPGEFMEQKKQDLFPSRSQERVQNIEEKDTSFEESETINPNLCTDYDCFEKYYQKVVAEQTIAEAFAFAAFAHRRAWWHQPPPPTNYNQMFQYIFGLPLHL